MATVVKASNGDKEWWFNGQRHRVDGPAVEWSDGTKMWWFNGQLHRVDGPALEKSDGTKEYFIEGIKLNEQEFERYQRLLCENKKKKNAKIIVRQVFVRQAWDTTMKNVKYFVTFEICGK